MAFSCAGSSTQSPTLYHVGNQTFNVVGPLYHGDLWPRALVCHPHWNCTPRVPHVNWLSIALARAQDGQGQQDSLSNLRGRLRGQRTAGRRVFEAEPWLSHRDRDSQATQRGGNQPQSMGSTSPPVTATQLARAPQQRIAHLTLYLSRICSRGIANASFHFHLAQRRSLAPPSLSRDGFAQIFPK